MNWWTDRLVDNTPPRCSPPLPHPALDRSFTFPPRPLLYLQVVDAVDISGSPPRPMTAADAADSRSPGSLSPGGGGGGLSESVWSTDGRRKRLVKELAALEKSTAYTDIVFELFYITDELVFKALKDPLGSSFVFQLANLMYAVCLQHEVFDCCRKDPAGAAAQSSASQSLGGGGGGSVLSHPMALHQAPGRQPGDHLSRPTRPVWHCRRNQR